MNENDRKGFLAAIDKAPWDDHGLRCIYADWLDENDEPQEADRQRQWVTASRWLREFADKCGHTCTNYDDVWRNRAEEEWEPITYEMLLQIGKDYVDDEEYFVQQGSERARDLLSGSENKRTRLDFWKNWSIVTGIEGPNDQDEFGHAPFCCTC